LDAVDDARKSLLWLQSGVRAQVPGSLEQRFETRVARGQGAADLPLLDDWLRLTVAEVEHAAAQALLALYETQPQGATQMSDVAGLESASMASPFASPLPSTATEDACLNLCRKDVWSGTSLADLLAKDPLVTFVVAVDGSLGLLAREPSRITLVRLDPLMVEEGVFSDPRSGAEALRQYSAAAARDPSLSTVYPLGGTKYYDSTAWRDAETKLALGLCLIIPNFDRRTPGRPQAGECVAVSSHLPQSREFQNEPRQFYPNPSGEITFVDDRGDVWWLGEVGLWDGKIETLYPGAEHIAVRKPKSESRGSGGVHTDFVNKLVLEGKATRAFASAKAARAFLGQSAFVFVLSVPFSLRAT